MWKVISSATSAKIWILCARLFIGLMFIASGIAKLQQPYDFLQTLYRFHIVGEKVGLLLATVIPWLELCVGACCLCGIMLQGAFALSVLLFSMFTLVQALALANGLSIPCGCFGNVAATTPIDIKSVGRAVLLLLIAIIALFASTRRSEKAALGLEGVVG